MLVPRDTGKALHRAAAFSRILLVAATVVALPSAGAASWSFTYENPAGKKLSTTQALSEGEMLKGGLHLIEVRFQPDPAAPAQRPPAGSRAGAAPAPPAAPVQRGPGTPVSAPAPVPAPAPVSAPAPARPAIGAGDTLETQLPSLVPSGGEEIPIEEAALPAVVAPAPEDQTVLRTLHFAYDAAGVRPEHRQALQEIARWLAKHRDRTLLVEGHCDERGTDEYNVSLGERRALAIRRALIALGADAERLSTISYGEEKPADPGHTQAAWTKNRRVEFKVLAR